MRFRLPDSAWAEMAAELESLGRLPSEGDRFSVELHVGAFVALRPRLGKNLPAPGRAAKAWERLAVAFERLQDAMADMPADCADLSLLGKWAPEFREALPEIAANARHVAELEAAGPKAGPRADPLRDNLVRMLLQLWCGYGGAASASVNAAGEADGPLVRFLTAGMNAASAAAGEEAPSPEALRHVIRAMAV